MSPTRKRIGSSYCMRNLTPRSRWTVVWSAWCGYFAVAEYVAVRSRHKDAPLSAHCRYLLRTRGDRVQRGLGQLALGSFLVWFIRHIYANANE